MNEEDLRERVQELEASVAGLTDELIECKTRLRDLEDDSDTDLAEVPTSDEPPTEADTSNGEDDDAAAESDPEDEQDSDDIIVA